MININIYFIRYKIPIALQMRVRKFYILKLKGKFIYIHLTNKTAV